MTVATNAPANAASGSAVSARERPEEAEAVRNAGVLSLSLIATWLVALVVRVMIPRHLGADQFGAYQFAESFAALVLVATNLGIETYVRKEVATRREHGSEFLGGVFLLRLLLSAVLTVAAVSILVLAGKPSIVQRLVLVMAVVQMLVIGNGTLAAVLHALGKVAGLATLNVGAKIAWAVGVIVALRAGGGVHGAALTVLVVELLRFAGLAHLVRRHVGRPFQFRLAPAVAVIVASAPFFLATVAVTVASRLDITFVSFFGGDREAGWYGAASNAAGIAMLLSPVMSWLLLPITARAAARSDAELSVLMQRVMGLVLSVVLPLSLFIGLGAPILVAALFGEAFAPSAGALRVLAPTFAFTYANMVSASALVLLGRGWTVTLTQLSALVVAAVLNWILVPRCMTAFGPGGAGIGAALALTITEGYIALSLTWRVRTRVFDRGSVRSLGKTLGACAVVLALDHFLRPVGYARLIPEALVYVVLVIGSGALNPTAVMEIARMAFVRRREVIADAA